MITAPKLNIKKELVLPVLLLSASLLHGGWDAEPAGGGYATWVSLAVDASGNVHASRNTDSLDNQLGYSKKEGGVWSHQVVDTGLGDDGYTSLALDSLGRPHISYQKSASRDLNFASWTGSSWSLQVVDSSGSVGYYTSLVIDSSDHRHVSYQDSTNLDLKYAYFDGVSWSTTTVDSVGSVGIHTSIALTPSGEPCISYYDATNTRVKLACRSGGVWSMEEVDPDGSGPTALAITTAGVPVVAYRGAAGLRYAGKPGASWAIQAFGTGTNVQFADISLDSLSRPHIAYNTGVDIRYAGWTGSQWYHSLIATNAGATSGRHVAIALDGAGIPSVAYNFSNFNLARRGTPTAASGVGVSSRTLDSLSWRWTDNADDETGYKVLRGGDLSDLSGLLPAGTTSWIQTGLLPNATSYIVVQAVNELGTRNAPQSAVQSALALPPVDTRVTGVFGSSVTIAWTDGGNSLTPAFSAEKSTDGVNFSLFSSGSIPHATATALLSDVTHYFRVKASNGSAISTAYDSVVSTVTLSAVPLAAGPPAISTRTTGSLSWRWTDNSNNELGFRVKRFPGGQNLSGDLPPGTTSWVQAPLGVNALENVVIEAFNGLGSSTSSSSGATYTLAMPPTESAITGVFGSSVALSWNTNGNPAGTTYVLERSANGTSYSQYFSFTQYASSGVATSLSGETLHYFRLKARNGNAVDTSADVVLSTTTRRAVPAAPSSPLVATRTSTSLDWRWTDQATTEEGYRVLNALALGTSFSGDLPANTTYWSQTGLTPNAQYRVQVEAFNESGAGRSSRFYFTDEEYTLAAVPVNLRVENAGAYSVDLAWDNGGNPAGTFYLIEKSTNGGSFASVGSVVTSTTATVTALDSATLYSFRVRARNMPGVNTAYTPAVSTTTLSGSPQLPLGPFVLSRTTDTIVWRWIDASGNEDGFRVVRSSDGADLSGALPPNTTTWAQTGLKGNELSRVQLEAFNAMGSTRTQAVYLGSHYERTHAYPAGAPSVFAVHATSVTLTWSALNNDPIVAYQVEYSTGPGFVPFTGGGPSSPATTQTVQSLSPGSTYYFRVATHYTVQSTSQKLVSAGVSAGTGLLPPATPSLLSVSSRTATRLNWAWQDNASDETGYRLVNESGASVSGDLPAGTTFWHQLGLGPNSRQVLQVESFNAGGASRSNRTYSATQEYTLANPPSGTAVSSASLSSVTVSWSLNGNAPGTRFDAFRSMDNVTFTQFLAAGAVSSATASGLLSGTTYYFRVRALNQASVATAYDAVVSTRTLTEAPVVANQPVGTAVMQTYVSSATLSWSANGNPAGTVYRAERSLNNAAFTEFYSGTALSAAATGLTKATVYYFRVRAQNAENILTGYDAVVSTRTLDAPPKPATGLKASARTASSITWAWTDNASNETGYRVRRSSDHADLSGALPAGAKKWVQPSLSPNEAQAVYVEAFRGGSLSYSSSRAAYTLALPPSSTAVGAVFTSSVTLSWTGAGNPAGTNYVVQMKKPGKSFKTVLTTSSTTGSVAGLSPKTSYSFRVASSNGEGVLSVFDVAAATKTAAAPLIGARSIASPRAAPGDAPLEAVKAYPIPFRPSLGHTVVTFSGLAPGSTVRIFTALGESVRETSADSSGMGSWDGRNGGGEAVASGTYVYSAEDASGSRKTGRLVVIR